MSREIVDLMPTHAQVEALQAEIERLRAELAALRPLIAWRKEFAIASPERRSALAAQCNLREYCDTDGRVWYADARK